MFNNLVLLFKKYTPIEFRIFLRKSRWIFLYYFQSIIGIKFHKKYYCPINEKWYRTYVKTGRLLLSKDLGARERHRFIWYYLKKESSLFTTPDITLLHISPEYCFYEKLKNIKNIKYHPVDKFEPGYDYLSLTKNFDLLDKNIESEKFDFIICNHVLEHIIDDKAAIGNIYRLLKKNGIAIVSVPILKNNAPTYEDYSITLPRERKKHFGQWDHVRYYGTDIFLRFEVAGFKVKTINSSEYFSESERKMYGVPKESYLFQLNKIG